MEDLITLLRDADLTAEQIEQAQAQLRAIAAGQAATAAELKTATSRNAELEQELEVAEAGISELRTLLSEAVAESRASIAELTEQFNTEVERRGQFEESVALTGTRLGGQTEDAVLIAEERLVEMESNNNAIPGVWNEIMRSYSREYGEFVPRFAPEMGRAPSHVAGLQAIRLPGESVRFVSDTQDATYLHLKQ